MSKKNTLPFPENHTTIQGSMSKVDGAKKGGGKASPNTFPGATENANSVTSKAPAAGEVQGKLFGSLAQDMSLTRQF